MKMEKYFFISKTGYFAMKNEMFLEELYQKFLFDDDKRVREFARHHAKTLVEPGERPREA